MHHNTNFDFISLADDVIFVALSLYTYLNFHTDFNLMISTNIEIPVGNSTMCISIATNNDEIPEYDESVLIIVRPDNPLDVVNQNTTLLIVDDDGLYSNERYFLMND